MARRLNQFESLYNEIAEPFGWKFTRGDLDRCLERLAEREDAVERLAT